MTNRCKITPATALSPTLGGGVTNTRPLTGPSLEDIMPYAPRIDRADLAFDNNDWCPQLRINYPDESECK